ncbi:MAG: DUF835 domain-containing protein, partial [Thermoplasmata archaeon]|nr:DUF835 domain-containing protein [Thermoplasmata archaeon]
PNRPATPTPFVAEVPDVEPATVVIAPTSLDVSPDPGPVTAGLVRGEPPNLESRAPATPPDIAPSPVDPAVSMTSPEPLTTTQVPAEEDARTNPEGLSPETPLDSVAPELPPPRVPAASVEPPEPELSQVDAGSLSPESPPLLATGTVTPSIAPEPGAPDSELTPSLAPIPAELPAPELLVPEVVAPPAPPPSGLAISSGALSNDAWPLFLDATGAGHRGLCISREFPDRMRALLGPRDVTICWLSNAGRAGAVRPTDLAQLGRVVEEAVTQQAVRAIYLDHVELLTRVNSVAPVLELLRQIDTLARSHDARVWVALNPTLLSASDADQLATAFPSAH